MADTLLIAGCSGALGREAARAARARGYRIRALTRTAARLEPIRSLIDEVVEADALQPGALAGACDGVQRVFSCLGASVNPSFKLGRLPYRQVDLPANRHLIDAAKAAGVSRFVYVSSMHTDAMRSLDYIAAHEEVARHLRESGLEHAVIRPTGFFSAFGEMLEMARGGFLPELGDGRARSNPIHDADLAEVCIDALEGGPSQRLVGGPDVLTRRQVAELIFAALNRPPRIVPMPLAVARFSGWLMRPINPRISHFTAFLCAINEQDLVAPAVGKRRLEDYFRERAASVNRPALPAG